jgi:hypothetical protein
MTEKREIDRQTERQTDKLKREAAGERKSE